jgi:hypothetical protein
MPQMILVIDALIAMALLASCFDDGKMPERVMVRT